MKNKIFGNFWDTRWIWIHGPPELDILLSKIKPEMLENSALWAIVMGPILGSARDRLEIGLF